MQIEVLSSPPLLAASGLPTGQKFGCFQGGYLKVRLAAATAPVGVRPYYERDGRWWPMRADGVSGVGVDPVTADPSVRGGLAEGLFACSGVSSFVCLVAESGTPASVVAAFVELVDQA